MKESKHYFLDVPNGIYSCPDYIEGGSEKDAVNLFQADCKVIYDIYDDLAERFPQFVTKTTMGEVGGYAFNRYRIAYYDIENTSGFALKRFKIAMTTSIHGYEPGCAWTAAHFFKLMCEHPEDEILSFLLRNVVFEIVPLGNPCGFAKNIRTNGNGVDINRNFPTDWVSVVPKGHSYYAGDTPSSEPETQLLMQFVEKNTDADWFIDYHNRSKPLPLFYIQDEEHLQIAYSVFATLTHKWQKQYDKVEKDRILGFVAKSAGAGMFSNYVYKKGLRIFTLETPEQMGGISEKMYDQKTIHTAMDVLVNTLLALVKSNR